MSLLRVENLTVRFGGLTAVGGVNFEIEPGSIFSVIGPNGAGKTTVFNAITGIYEPTEGRVLLDGGEIKAPFGARTVLGLAGIAAVTALGGLLAFNIEPMWEAVITDNFVYQKPFPWGEALKDLIAFVRGLPVNKGLVPVLSGAMLGAAGGLAAWGRSRRAPHFIARNGIARTFQNIRLFQEMTVVENVLCGMHGRLKTRLHHILLRLPLFRREQRESLAAAIELLRFTGLEAESFDPAKSLSYGHQRRLEIARALATSPRLLLLDEPAAGMNPAETVDLMELIRRIRERGVTVLLIEHHMRVVMGISDRIAVLDYGVKIAEGTPEAIRSDPKVIEAYLGKEELD